MGQKLRPMTSDTGPVTGAWLLIQRVLRRLTRPEDFAAAYPHSYYRVSRTCKYYKNISRISVYAHYRLGTRTGARRSRRSSVTATIRVATRQPLFKTLARRRRPLNNSMSARSSL